MEAAGAGLNLWLAVWGRGQLNLLGPFFLVLRKWHHTSRCGLADPLVQSNMQLKNISQTASKCTLLFWRFKPSKQKSLRGWNWFELLKQHLSLWLFTHTVCRKFYFQPQTCALIIKNNNNEMKIILLKG